MTTLADRIDQFLREENSDAPLQMYKSTIAEWRDEVTTMNVITREIIVGNPVSIADTHNALLTWDESQGPDVLLDLTNPVAPVVIDAGVYAVSTSILGSLSPGGTFGGRLRLDATGEQAFVFETVGPGGIGPYLSLTETWYIPEGGVIEVRVWNEDGTATQDFIIEQANVQRLS
jgi:hypothetical protein